MDDPVPIWYIPDEQLEQLEFPLLTEYIPAAQFSHAELPAVCAYWPPWQVLQLVDAAFPINCPTEQVAQLEAPLLA